MVYSQFFDEQSNKAEQTMENVYTFLKSRKEASVHLRAIEPEDLDLMYLVENDTSLWAFGSTTVPYSHHSLREFILNTRNDIFQDGQLRLVIESREGEALGFIDLQNFEARHRRAEVGIVLLPSWQGKGYATDALQLLCEYASDHLSIRQLTAVVAERNKRALRLFQRAGFTCLTVLPQWLCCGTNFENATLWHKLF